VILTVGSKVVYPCQGPCLVVVSVERVVAGERRSFCHLVVLADGGGKLFVPVDRVQTLGVRPLVKRSDVPKLLDQLTKTTEIAKDWKQRADDVLRLFTSGSAFDLAEIVGSLTELSKAKALSLRRNWMLVRARKLLACEISEVMGETKSAAEEQVDQALKARKIAVVSGNQIINPSANSAGAYDVSAIGARQDRVMYGGEDGSNVPGLLESGSTP
jgi:RNA polymerase-interacting CarD/CdnL/TRCF family regulator